VVLSKNAHYYWHWRFYSGDCIDLCKRGFRTETPTLVDIRPVTASYITINDWNHIVGSYSSGTKKFYINGVLISNVTTTGSVVANSYGVSLGAYGGSAPSYWYNGYVGEARIYNRQLSNSEVLFNYNNTKGRYLKKIF
jgi:hypothetical protein